MNKNINSLQIRSLLAKKEENKRIQNQRKSRLNTDSETGKPIKYGLNYLDVDISPSHSQQPQRIKFLSKKLTSHPFEPIAIRKVKQDYRCKRKRLIIQDVDNQQLQKESNSLVLHQHQSLDNRPIKTISSQKKTRLGTAFLMSSPPKKYKVQDKKCSLQEDSKCELIRSIIEKYKEAEKIIEEPGSPCISSVKLNKKQLKELKSKEERTIKFFGKKVGLPNKLQSKLYLRRNNMQTKANELLKTRWAEISPWNTQQEQT